MNRTFLAISLAATLSLAGCFDYSDGQRVGTVIKFSKKGLFCKTWEGEMLLGGMKKKTSTDANGNSSSSMVVNTFEFTVENEAMVPKIAAALESGEPITVTYKQELATFCRSDANNYFITSVK